MAAGARSLRDGGRVSGGVRRDANVPEHLALCERGGSAPGHQGGGGGGMPPRGPRLHPRLAALSALDSLADVRVHRRHRECGPRSRASGRPDPKRVGERDSARGHRRRRRDGRVDCPRDERATGDGLLRRGLHRRRCQADGSDHPEPARARHHLGSGAGGLGAPGGRGDHRLARAERGRAALDRGQVRGGRLDLQDPAVGDPAGERRGQAPVSPPRRGGRPARARAGPAGRDEAPGPSRGQARHGDRRRRLDRFGGLPPGAAVRSHLPDHGGEVGERAPRHQPRDRPPFPRCLGDAGARGRQARRPG